MSDDTALPSMRGVQGARESDDTTLPSERGVKGARERDDITPPSKRGVQGARERDDITPPSKRGVQGARERDEITPPSKRGVQGARESDDITLPSKRSVQGARESDDITLLSERSVKGARESDDTALPLPSRGRGSGRGETVVPRAPHGRARMHPAAFLTLVLGLVAMPAFAHKGSDAYWTLRADGPHLSGRYEVALRDLALVQALDTNADRAVTWGELRASEGALCERLTGHLALTQQGAPCTLRCTGLQVVEHSDGRYASVPLDGECPGDITSLDVTYSMLFDVDGEHRGLLSLTGEQGGHWEAFSTDTRTRRVTFDRITQSAQAGHAFAQGVHHIAIGWDHLCFLFALLLPSVLRREGTSWAPREGLRTTLGDVTKVVTAFTLAHSVTLALAAFEVVHPNGKWVEVAIALSVALAALNNLMPFVPDTRWSLAFALGLLHGFGFVSAIQDLGASARALWVSVLGFNLGVEAGQLAIVGAFVPLAWLVRARPAYVKVLLPLGSALILGIALFWTTERL